MDQETIPAGRPKERVFLLIVTVVLSLLFLRLFLAEQRNFTEVDKRLGDGTMVNLNTGHAAKNIRALLEKGYYFEDKRDIYLIESVLADRITAAGKFENIGELNKRKYNVNAEEATNK